MALFSILGHQLIHRVVQCANITSSKQQRWELTLQPYSSYPAKLVPPNPCIRAKTDLLPTKPHSGTAFLHVKQAGGGGEGVALHTDTSRLL